MLKQYDVVALTVDLPEENLQVGQVGTIVEVLNNGEAFIIDFVDRKGFTYALLTLTAEQLMLLHHEPVIRINDIEILGLWIDRKNSVEEI